MANPKYKKKAPYRPGNKFPTGHHFRGEYVEPHNKAWAELEARLAKCQIPDGGDEILPGVIVQNFQQSIKADRHLKEVYLGKQYQFAALLARFEAIVEYCEDYTHELSLQDAA